MKLDWNCSEGIKPNVIYVHILYKKYQRNYFLVFIRNLSVILGYSI